MTLSFNTRANQVATSVQAHDTNATPGGPPTNITLHIPAIFKPSQRLETLSPYLLDSARSVTMFPPN
jgi:hypothetical protein